MKEKENEHTNHTNECNMWPRKPNMTETELEGNSYALISFLQLWKCKDKERDTHYGVSFDTVA